MLGPDLARRCGDVTRDASQEKIMRWSEKYNTTTGNFTKVFAGNSRHKTNINGSVDWAFLFVIYNF